MGPRLQADLSAMAIVAAVYFAAAKVGLMLAPAYASAPAVWPPTGIALAAILMLGYRVWPGVLLGAFLATVTMAGTAGTSAGIAVGNTLEGLVGAYLVNRFAGGRDVLGRPRDILRFAVLAGMVSTAVSATLGVTALSLGGVAPWSSYGVIWLTWWLGDAGGTLIVAPLLLLWLGRPRLQVESRRLLEAVLWLACLLAIGEIVFGGWLPIPLGNRPIAFLCIPVLVGVAYRFGQRATATASFVLSGLAIWGTLRGFGPFAVGTPDESRLLLQGFMAVTTVMAMTLSAAVAESRRGEAARSRLASIVESSHDAIIGTTLDGTILSWNSGATSLYGYTAEEAIGRSVSILAPRHRPDEVPGIHERIRRGERVEAFETLRMTKDGRMLTVSLTISPVTDADGRVLGSSGIARDVTHRNRAEEAARRAEALLSVTRLANAAAHEINNPLTAILVPLQLLARDQPEGSESKRRLTMALDCAERIRQIVARLQGIMKLEVADQHADLPERLDLQKSAPVDRKES